MQEQADRYNEGKLRWSLVDFRSLEPLVRVLEYGADKYDDENWKKGLPFKQVCESIMRHLTAFMRGEDLDHESGQPHTAHIMANCMFLEYYFTSGLNFKFDDRTEHVMKGQRLREELEEVIEAVQADVVKIETDDDELIEALKGSDYKRMNIIQDLQRQIKEKDEQLAKYNKDVDAYTEVLNRIMPCKLDKDNE